jgi:hypothetical protein
MTQRYEWVKAFDMRNDVYQPVVNATPADVQLPSLQTR